MSNNRFLAETLAIVAASAAFFNMEAQSVVGIGGGSIASHPPTYNEARDENGIGNSSFQKMLTRSIFVDELPSVTEGGLSVPGRPIPTNDWWTDIINSRYSGALWAYPAMVNTSETGVEVRYPTYWADAGKEVKSRSAMHIGGSRYSASAAIACDWHDWDVTFRMPARQGDGNMKVTLAHGMPFVWVELTDIKPEITFSALAVDAAVATAYPSGTKPVVKDRFDGGVAVLYGDDLYGIYYPAGTSCDMDEEGVLTLGDGTPWLVAALLCDAGDLRGYDKYAVSLPRKTEVSWRYDESAAVMNTEWQVDAENLRDSLGPTEVLQGFLPHVYKHALPGAVLPFISGREYLTPRGRLRMAASASGRFAFSYQFNGMLPAFAPPKEGNSDSNGYEQPIMDELMDTYASKGTFGDDTYWGGKGLTQMALNMSFAKETGNTAVYEKSKSRLREALVNWLTYTPGENNRLLSYYPRWGGILGFAYSFVSEEFNDHHFHFGYFTYAAALLCLEDREFAGQYGELLTLIAKDYANWDRSDLRFPFMRTLDPWCGHSWAGGLGDAGNDNGNGQESSSEAMQGWGGVYLLGVALDDKEMRDAGLFGWNLEARATREYWYDVDQPRQANVGGREAWPGKNMRDGHYDYSLYPYAYNSNITGKGIGWWTWFGGDPLYMHGIQWMPISPALDYLSWDTDFVGWAYRDMMSGANSTFSHEWFENTSNTADGSNIDALATNDWGNVTLAYLQRYDPELAASIFSRAWREGYHIAKSVSTSHISYYTLHNTLTYGVPDTGYHAGIPTACVFNKDGRLTFMVYNPGDEDLEVPFYDAAGVLVKTVRSAPGRLTVFDKGEPEATELTVGADGGFIVPPGASATVAARVLDQYGAGMPGCQIAFALSPGAPAAMRGSELVISGDAARGSQFSLTAMSSGLTQSMLFTVNDRPEPCSARISGVAIPDDGSMPVFETGTCFDLSLHYTDQYGCETVAGDAMWSYVTTAGAEGVASSRFAPSTPGVYTLTGTSVSQPLATASVTMFITPELPSISKGSKATTSSEENVGSVSANINDGDAATRWGSAHTPDEWVFLDLGEDKFVTRVGIRWENAYASEYEIEIAPSGCAMTPHTGRYADGVKTVMVPSEWTAAATVRLSSYTDEEIMTAVNATGRYIRMKGVSRGTEYGYSIYEMTAYGLDGSIGDDDILGIDCALPEVMDQGGSVVLAPVVYSRSGEILDDVSLTYSADKEARFDGDCFTPLSYGHYKVTATASDGTASTGTIFVNEAIVPRTIVLSPSSSEMVEGETIEISYTAYDQLNAIYPLDISGVSVEVFDESGKITDGASYDLSTCVFAGDCPGHYTIRLSAASLSACATVAVKAVSEANLALRKPTSASSSNGGNVSGKANDGDRGTRWESLWNDGQWIQVDLLDCYIVDRMKIDWDPAAARKYRVLSSVDGEYWREIHATVSGKGGREELGIYPAQPARYLRLVCDQRLMPAYGVSVNEWEIYGLERFTAVDDGVTPVINSLSVVPSNGVIAVVADITGSADPLNVTVTIAGVSGEIVAEKVINTACGKMSVDFIDIAEGDYVVTLTAADVFGNRTTVSETCGVTVIEPVDNVALNKTVWASSEDGGFKAGNVVDGDTGSRWKSTGNTGEPWIVADLGESYRVYHVRLLWEGAYATDYEIMVADDCTEGTDNGNFRTVFHRTDGAAGWDMMNITPVACRYVMMKAHSLINDGWGASLYQLEVYGDHEPVSGVGCVTAPDDTCEDAYYTLQGIRVARPSSGIYIRVRDGRASKVAVTARR